MVSIDDCAVGTDAASETGPEVKKPDGFVGTWILGGTMKVGDDGSQWAGN
jgi:hypothetical protein